MWIGLFLSLESSFQLSHLKQLQSSSMAPKFFHYSLEKQRLSFCIWFMSSALSFAALTLWWWCNWHINLLTRAGAENTSRVSASPPGIVGWKEAVTEAEKSGCCVSSGYFPGCFTNVCLCVWERDREREKERERTFKLWRSHHLWIGIFVCSWMSSRAWEEARMILYLFQQIHIFMMFS